MKTGCCSLIVFALLTLTIATGFCGTEDPDPAVSANLKRLDALVRVFEKTQANDDQFGAEFWRASKRLADQQGVAIIHAVMYISRKWKGEEGLIYVPLVALLPRHDALKILHHYQHSRRETDRVWAGEFITEFEMSDTQEALQKYSGKK